ncbi:LAGLIDADG family homing endonuclease [Neobacillus sp. 179-C4.2 HS]|uniref:LAGLIDADG family homing endonuclease n=1 Tax=Neobacillus driksii TaxID=3035913 RepID=A0ABV4YM87_9BACI|nr:LAGLIDADG family homing endonuclease [Neobacillus sp. 179.-C4.2 HS]MDP5193264.1 LAGLIDADG family homing endonuclease [Neobacillus sp. 179.-C4.2 HS]
MVGKKGSVHAKLTKMEYKGEIVDAKVCNQCKLIKPLEHFYKAPNGIGQRRPKCISCMSPTGRKITKIVEAVGCDYHQLGKQCKICKKILPLKDFYKGKGAGGTSPNCKTCIRERASEERKIRSLERKKIKDVKNIDILSKEDYSNIWTMQKGSPQALLYNDKDTGDIFKVITKEGYEVLIPHTYKICVITKQTRYIQNAIWKPIKDLEVGDLITLLNLRDIQPWEGNGNFDQGWLVGEVLGDGGLSGEYAYLAFWGNSQQELTKISVERIKSNLGARVDLAGTYAALHDRTSIKSSKLTELIKVLGLEKIKDISPQIEMSSYKFYRGLMRGLFDSDGSVQGTQEKGVSVRLHQSNLPFLQKVQRMLLRLGIVSSIYKNRRDAGYRLLPDGKGGSKLYFCQAQHELVVANDNIVRFRDIIGFQEPEKKQRLNDLINNFKRRPNRERFTAIVDSIHLDRQSVNFKDCNMKAPIDLNGIIVRKQ